MRPICAHGRRWRRCTSKASSNPSGHRTGRFRCIYHEHLGKGPEGYQKTIFGSWVTSIWLMEELVELIVRWDIHPDKLITHRFPLAQAAEAYALMASGDCGKVAVCFDGELKSQS